jgi:lipase chaperone LimK
MMHGSATKTKRILFFWLTAGILGTVLIYAIWSNSQVQHPPPSKEQASGWRQAGVANPFLEGAPQPQADHRAVEPIQTMVVIPSIQGSSLDGTQADGDWGVNAQGQLRATLALRQRFDYYLSLIGEKPLADIEAIIKKSAQESLKEPALGQVMALWNAYVKLQQHPDSWSAALIERRGVRKQMMGADWAHAFYADEESRLQQTLNQLNSPNKKPATLPQAGSFALHPEAAQREAELKVKWQEWEQRLEAARGQLRAFRSAPELSEPQRQQAIESYLAQQFRGTELIRARALLGV